ncbi:hypothetical protein INT44_001962 [Umbelopsis vinacea]|uniref:Uncharacterized protein n=1 Tax=Umbelopsis vinacea TaxID=44442 RepID=A0A8H7Q2Y9_9FUNG|nr:hypothetical protein INT44_001962 [Umbelopsis vinacea]
MMRAYSIARHDRRSHKRNSVIIPDNVKILSDVSEGGQETSTSADHLIEPIASCIGTEDVNHDASLEVLEELQQEISEASDHPSEPCHIDDVISEEPSEIVQEQSEEAQIPEETHVAATCTELSFTVEEVQPNVEEETEDNEVTHDTTNDTTECVEEPVCDASNQETTEVKEDATPSEAVLCMDEEPATVTEVPSKEPVMHVNEEQTGDEVVEENQPSEEVIIDSGTCTDENLDETEPTKLDASKDDELVVVQSVEYPETQENEVADLSVLTTEKEGEKKSVSMVSDDDSQRETPSPSFRKDRKRRMSIRRLSDAFVRSKFPGPVESPTQETPSETSESTQSSFNAAKKTAQPVF